jgi:hypothetical protein
MNSALGEELLAMADDDRQVRAQLLAEGALGKGYHAAIRELHDRNAARLSEIIEEHGWPGRSLVGEDGAYAAWFILQHAIAQAVLQRRGLPLLQEAARRGEIPTRQVAY